MTLSSFISRRIFGSAMAAITSFFCINISGCTGTLPAAQGADPAALPAKLLTIDDLAYAGAFALPTDTFGLSSANWAEGIIEVAGKSIFLAGHAHDDAIAEFTIPPLSKSANIEGLKAAEPPVQPFTDILEKADNGNPQHLDQIVGLELYKGKLFGNAIEYYDAPADNSQSTFVLDNSNDLSASRIHGFYTLNGKARAAGWLSRVPEEYQQIIGCSHISGHSSGGAIISRHSVGPSAFCVNLDDLLINKPRKTIRTAEMLGFSLNFPLHTDLTNETGDNQLWTHVSQARYGFIVPGTRTYMTVGRSGGHNSGIGYKLKRSDDVSCPGHCANDPADNYNYYWLWNMQDLVNVRLGRKPASTVKPYETGVFPTPFQSGRELHPIGGGSYDESTGLLYLTLLNANHTPGSNHNPPVVLAYNFSTR